MTPKDKAKDLYDKFYAWYPNQDAQFIAKQCTLIAVDELIKEQTMWQNGEINPKLYWQNVKTEIEKL
jgi:hypothetical protein